MELTPFQWVIVALAAKTLVSVTCFALMLHRARRNMTTIMQHVTNVAVQRSELTALIAKEVEQKLTNRAESVERKLDNQATEVQAQLTAQADKVHEQLVKTASDASTLSQIEKNTAETASHTAPLVAGGAPLVPPAKTAAENVEAVKVEVINPADNPVHVKPAVKKK